LAAIAATFFAIEENTEVMRLVTQRRNAALHIKAKPRRQNDTTSPPARALAVRIAAFAMRAMVK
jgi:hypothetical protein